MRQLDKLYEFDPTIDEILDILDVKEIVEESPVKAVTDEGVGSRWLAAL